MCCISEDWLEYEALSQSPRLQTMGLPSPCLDHKCPSKSGFLYLVMPHSAHVKPFLPFFFPWTAGAAGVKEEEGGGSSDLGGKGTSTPDGSTIAGPRWVLICFFLLITFIIIHSMLAEHWQVLGYAGFYICDSLGNIWWEFRYINFSTNMHTCTQQRSKFLLCFPVSVLCRCAALGGCKVVPSIVGKDNRECIVIDVFELCWIQQSGIMWLDHCNAFHSGTRAPARGYES